MPMHALPQFTLKVRIPVLNTLIQQISRANLVALHRANLAVRAPLEPSEALTLCAIPAVIVLVLGILGQAIAHGILR